jgi:hypothetical protein
VPHFHPVQTPAGGRTGRPASAQSPRVAGPAPGLASGLSNTALQIGRALGVAIVSTVAVSRSAGYLAANKGANPLVAATEGYQSAFAACAVLAGIGLALALLLPGRPRTAAHELPEPVPATRARD